MLVTTLKKTESVQNERLQELLFLRQNLSLGYKRIGDHNKSHLGGSGVIKNYSFLLPPRSGRSGFVPKMFP